MITNGFKIILFGLWLWECMRNGLVMVWCMGNWCEFEVYGACWAVDEFIGIVLILTVCLSRFW